MDLFILLATCATNLLLGMLVLLRDVRKPYTQTFALISVCTSVWIISNYITDYSISDLSVTNIANKFAYVSGYATVVSGLLFTYYFPLKRKVRPGEYLIVGIITIGMLGLSFTDTIAGEASLTARSTLIYSSAPLLWLYIVGFLGTVGMIARNLLTIPRSEGFIKRRQARFILFAFSASALTGLLLNVILPLFVQEWNTTHLGPLVTVILVGTVAYTIVRHGLFDIRLAAIRGMAYLLSLSTMTGLYYLAAYTISAIFFHDQYAYATSQSPLSIGLALMLVFIFQPIKGFFDRLTSRIFYRSNYSIDEFIIEMSRRLTMPGDLRSLLRRAAGVIADTIKVEQVFFFIRYSNHVMSSGTQAHGRLSIEDSHILDRYFQNTKSEVLVAETMGENEEAQLHHLLSQHKLAIIVPLWQADILIGYVLLGNKRSGYYVPHDLKALRTIRDELVIAIQNALSVQEVKDINATLQQRIEDATKELRASNMQLQRLDEAKDEFVSMASHQLRTPLTSVKGYISMVLEGDAGKITKMQSQLLAEAFTSSERMVHLINDFLNVSRLQTGKFILESRPVDLAKIVTQEVDSLQTTAGAHNLKLKYHTPSYFPILYLDEGKIRQVLMNFIDNAIYYSREHTTITVELSVRGGDVVMEVHDTGIGVPKPEQAHLFTKFFRATNARRQRPDGTGVGLFLAKKVIVAHGGSMVFESVEGVGSTFGFRLPVKALSTTSAKRPDELDG